MMKTLSLKGFEDHIGKKIGTSRWFTIDQSRIDAFADVTEDHQFIHIDPEKAAETPFGQTVAHGFLTLSMLSAMSYDAIPRIEGLKMGVNYGFNKIRFVTPV
ncbi:MAG: MaoC family dehydratase, partial [Paracoccaceae bacterium]